MSNSDAFALRKSGLSEFLFAEVGTELNGSRLTILSVLARLGKDPWKEAARWATLPAAAGIDCLACSISQMPLCPPGLVEAHVTATRLIRLLPSQTSSGDATTTIASDALPKWLSLALLAILVFGIATTFFESKPPAVADTPIAQKSVISPQPPTN